MLLEHIQIRIDSIALKWELTFIKKSIAVDEIFDVSSIALDSLLF